MSRKEHKDINVVIPLKAYEKLLENRSKVIDALGDMLLVLRQSHIRLEELLTVACIEGYKETTEYKSMLKTLNKYITYSDKSIFLGFDKESGKLLINE